ncbi:hypothetical protein V2J09_004788 [Rumex salicifolius]
MENNNQSFWQFTDQLRLQNSDFANLSLNDSIWSVNAFGSKRPEERRNFDIRVGGDFPTTPTTPNPIGRNNNVSPYDFKQKNVESSDFNAFNDGWKVGSGMGSGFGIPNNPNFTPQNTLNGGFNKGMYSKPYMNQNYNNFNLGVKDFNGNNLYLKNFNGKVEDDHHQHHHASKVGKKKKEGKRENNKDDNNKNAVDKRFKTLPPAEALPRNETIGGYIFVCNNDTMEENLKRQLFGLPPRYRDSVRAITPGLPLFLYNYSTHQLHGIYEAASFGGSNIDAYAWEDKKNPGESRFPAQVRVQTRKICEPLEEDAFRPILHHYDGPKFRLELSVPEALSLLDIFEVAKA